MINILSFLISAFKNKAELQKQLSYYQGRCEDLEIRLAQLQKESDKCKQNHSNYHDLESQLSTSLKETKQFRNQVLALRDWISHVHRLDSISVKGTIEDILRRTRS